MNQERLHRKLEELYGRDAADAQMKRYGLLLARFAEEFGTCEPYVFRAPGRTEIGGNHTDHQHGQVLAAAIDLDIAAAASPAEDAVIRVYSEGFGNIGINLNQYGEEEKAVERGTAAALVRGVAEEMRERGYCAGGFCAYVSSSIPQGAGLSSSAAFEVLIGVILSGLYNHGSIPPGDIAQIAQAVENCYYGKPCGLMDQMTCATGGLCRIDFSNLATPAVEKLDVDFQSMGYSICITDTHGSHAEHTEDYAAVQTDLANAAKVFGKKVLEDVSLEEVISHAAEIRRAGGDRSLLRAMHVAAENDRVLGEAAALKEGNMPVFLDFVRRSGDSSYKLLQNVHVDRTPERQELAVALAVSEAVLKDKAGSACRVHGGGFAGTIQAFVKEEYAEEYRMAMDSLFGEGSCFFVRICGSGGTQIARSGDDR